MVGRRSAPHDVGLDGHRRELRHADHHGADGDPMSTRLVARAILALSAALALALLLPTTGSAQRAVAPARTVAARSAVVPPGDGPEIPDLEAEREVGADRVPTPSAPLRGGRAGGRPGGRGGARVVVLPVGIPAVAIAGRTT